MKKSSRLSESVLLLMLSLCFPICALVIKIQFQQNCEGFLKQAADANTVELCLERLNKAITYVEDNNLTDGYTSVFWKTEDQNIGYWYKNLKACQEELQKCIQSSQLKKTNVLMKVRESLTDNSSNGTDLTIPSNIEFYPYNALWLFIFIISGLLFL